MDFDSTNFINSTQGGEAGFPLASWAVSVLVIVAYWLLFQKAGEPGWKILIPFYGDYIKFKIANKKNLYWGFLISSILFSFSIAFSLVAFILAMFSAGGQNIDVAFSLLVISGGISFVTFVLFFIFDVLRKVGMAKAFGQSGLFALGLILFEPIFVCILAFSNNINYIGSIPERMYECAENHFDDFSEIT